MFSVMRVTCWLGTTSGPVTISGTRMSVSNAVIFPGVSRWSPMWYPLSELKKMYVLPASPFRSDQPHYQ